MGPQAIVAKQVAAVAWTHILVDLMLGTSSGVPERRQDVTEGAEVRRESVSVGTSLFEGAQRRLARENQALAPEGADGGCGVDGAQVHQRHVRRHQLRGGNFRHAEVVGGHVVVLVAQSAH